MKVSVDVYMFGYLINPGILSYFVFFCKFYVYIWLFVLWNTDMSWDSEIWHIILLKVKHNFFHKYYNSIYRFKSVFFVMHLNTILLCIHWKRCSVQVSANWEHFRLLATGDIFSCWQLRDRFSCIGYAVSRL